MLSVLYSIEIFCIRELFWEQVTERIKSKSPRNNHHRRRFRPQNTGTGEKLQVRLDPVAHRNTGGVI